MQKIGIVGAGTMGSGIALVFAQNGFDVVLKEINQNFMEKGINSISKVLQRNVEKGKMKKVYNFSYALPKGRK